MARLEASRTTAKDSGKRSSRGSPFARRSLNSGVFLRRASSERAEMEGSNALILSTSGRSFLSVRSFCDPKIFLRKSRPRMFFPYQGAAFFDGFPLVLSSPRGVHWIPPHDDRGRWGRTGWRLAPDRPPARLWDYRSFRRSSHKFGFGLAGCRRRLSTLSGRTQDRVSFSEALLLGWAFLFLLAVIG